METRLSEAPTQPSIPQVDGIQPVGQRDSFERHLREERLLVQLRNLLRNRPARNEIPGDPDHYEPQRLTRKICWQYDGHARKTTFLRRPYI